MVVPSEVFKLEGRDAVDHRGLSVSVTSLADLLELRSQRAEPRVGVNARTCIFLAPAGERFGVFVDELVDEQEVVFKPQGTLLRRVRNVAGATILHSGEVCMVLNPADLLASVRGRLEAEAPTAAAIAGARRKAVLLAEDSITTRTQETRILEGAGYEVIAASDGLDA